MEPSLELVLYRRYVGTVQRTLNTKDGLRLDDYCRVIGVRHDEENDLLFEVTSVHGPTAQSLIQVGPMQAVRHCIGNMRDELQVALAAACTNTSVELTLKRDPTMTNRRLQRSSSSWVEWSPTLLAILGQQLKRLEEEVCMCTSSEAGRARLLVAGTPFGALIDLVTARVTTDLTTDLPPPFTQSGSIIARRVCGELNATLAAAFQKHAADTAVMLNINHSEEELGYSLVVEYGRLLAGEISSAVASLAQAYTRKWTHQAEAEAGERRRALAAAKELIKELDEAQTVAIELVTLEHELKELMRATKDLGYRGTHPRFRGVKPVVLAERTAKLQTEVAKKRKKLERNSVYKSRLASVLNDLGSSSQQPAELSASVLKLVKSVRVELMRDESRASVLTDQAVKTLSQHEAISERVRIVAAGLRSEPWHNMLSSYLSEITEHVLPLRGHPVGAIRAKLDALPGSSILGATLEELKQYLSEHECADFASSMKREMAATLEHAAQASETGLYSDCVLCQDALCQDALANVPHDSATIGTFNALCNWHHGVCGAGGGKSCWVANGATRVVRLHAVAFQPLPIFMWFGLEDDACLADVKTAFRRLSRVHHPDKGGSIVEWELTRLCHQLVPDERTLTGYVEKRNHDHFVDTSLGLVDQSVVDRREQLADMQVARQAAQEDARKTSKSKTAQGTASRSEAIWEQGADGAGAEAVRARKRSHQPRALHDQDSEIVRMPKCSVTLDRRLERGKAALIIIWAQKMGERLLYESGGVYVLEYQRTWGVNGKTEWVEVYRGRGLRMCHEVIDDDDTYVSEHNYRCSAVTTEWQSLPSDIFTYSIDLHGNNLPQHVTEAQGQQRFERYLGTTVKLLEASCRGTLSNDDLAKLVRRIDNIARDSSRIGPSWMTRLATAGGLDAEGGTVLARTAAAQRALLEQRNTSERRELAHRTAKVEWRTRIDHAMRMCSTADGAKAAAASMKEWEDELDAFVGRFAVAEEGVPKGSGLDPHQKQLRAMLMNLTRQKRDEAATKARTLEGIERAAKHVQGVTKTRVPSTSASAPGATPAVSAAPQQDGDAADAALLAHVMEVSRLEEEQRVCTEAAAGAQASGRVLQPGSVNRAEAKVEQAEKTSAEKAGLEQVAAAEGAKAETAREAQSGFQAGWLTKPAGVTTKKERKKQAARAREAEMNFAMLYRREEAHRAEKEHAAQVEQLLEGALKAKQEAALRAQKEAALRAQKEAALRVQKATEAEAVRKAEAERVAEAARAEARRLEEMARLEANQANQANQATMVPAPTVPVAAPAVAKAAQRGGRGGRGLARGGRGTGQVVAPPVGSALPPTSPPAPAPTTAAPAAAVSPSPHRTAPPAATGRAAYRYAALTALCGEWSDEYRLGSGASGTVYRCQIDGTPVAVKRFDAKQEAPASDASAAAISTSAHASWQTELQLLSTTAHSNVVPLLGSSSDGPHLCLCYVCRRGLDPQPLRAASLKDERSSLLRGQEFCDGGSLFQRLERTHAPCPHPLVATQRVIILSDIGRGLSHLNSIGVVHRDIKPDNILLQRIGLGPQAGLLARIGDFGTARALEAEAQCTGSTTMMTRTRTWHAAQAQGTQVYMAPEYLKSAACSNKVDSFAFGLTIVVTLTGLRAEQRVPKGGGASGGHAGGDEHANLLEYFYDELEDEPAAFVRRLDNAGANGDAGAWDDLLDTVSTLHEIASNCLEPKVKKRPEMRELAPELERARADAEARPVVPSEFCCPLSLEVMKDPVVAADGVTYERAQIERWLLEHDTSPASGVALAHKHITPNLALRDMILRSVAR